MNVTMEQSPEKSPENDDFDNDDVREQYIPGPSLVEGSDGSGRENATDAEELQHLDYGATYDRLKSIRLQVDNVYSWHNLPNVPESGRRGVLVYDIPPDLSLLSFVEYFETIGGKISSISTMHDGVFMEFINEEALHRTISQEEGSKIDDCVVKTNAKTVPGLHTDRFALRTQSPKKKKYIVWDIEKVIEGSVNVEQISDHVFVVYSSQILSDPSAIEQKLNQKYLNPNLFKAERVWQTDCFVLKSTQVSIKDISSTIFQSNADLFTIANVLDDEKAVIYFCRPPQKNELKRIKGSIPIQGVSLEPFFHQFQELHGITTYGEDILQLSLSWKEFLTTREIVKIEERTRKIIDPGKETDSRGILSPTDSRPTDVKEEVDGKTFLTVSNCTSTVKSGNAEDCTANSDREIPRNIDSIDLHKAAKVLVEDPTMKCMTVVEDERKHSTVVNGNEDQTFMFHGGVEAKNVITGCDFGIVVSPPTNDFKNTDGVNISQAAKNSEGEDQREKTRSSAKANNVKMEHIDLGDPNHPKSLLNKNANLNHSSEGSAPSHSVEHNDKTDSDRNCKILEIGDVKGENVLIGNDVAAVKHGGDMEFLDPPKTSSPEQQAEKSHELDGRSNPTAVKVKGNVEENERLNLQLNRQDIYLGSNPKENEEENSPVKKEGSKGPSDGDDGNSSNTLDLNVNGSLIGNKTVNYQNNEINIITPGSKETCDRENKKDETDEQEQAGEKKDSAAERKQGNDSPSLSDLVSQLQKQENEKRQRSMYRPTSNSTSDKSLARQSLFDFSDSNLTSEKVARALSANMKYVSCLNLQHSVLSEEAIHALMSETVKVEKINFAGAKLRNSGVRGFAQHLGKVKVAILSNVMLDDNGVQPLLNRLSRLGEKNMDVLDISFNPISSRSVSKLLRQSTKVRVMIFSKDQIKKSEDHSADLGHKVKLIRLTEGEGDVFRHFHDYSTLLWWVSFSDFTFTRWAAVSRSDDYEERQRLLESSRSSPTDRRRASRTVEGSQYRCGNCNAHIAFGQDALPTPFHRDCVFRKFPRPIVFSDVSAAVGDHVWSYESEDKRWDDLCLDSPEYEIQNQRSHCVKCRKTLGIRCINRETGKDFWIFDKRRLTEKKE